LWKKLSAGQIYHRGVSYPPIKEDKMKRDFSMHSEELPRLKRIEGQIQGIQRMIEEKRYCIDILTQLSAVVGAIMKVKENILTRHLETCVHRSLSKGSRRDREEKIKEVITLLSKFGKP